MSFDISRFSFHPWHDYVGVVMQQGRVQLDSDWNEWVAELGRRLQAGTMDTFGGAVVPRTTPEGFHILAAGGTLTIGVGRIYVDGLLAENHGATPLRWDASLAELTGTTAVPFLDQPYLPFNDTAQPAPANIFNAPTLSGGPHLVYVDVWQRDVTYLQAPDLVETAVGVDTTGRLQTVWQVKLLTNIANANCSTPDDGVPGWATVIQPSGARMSTSPGTVTGDPNPCEIPPSADYKGLENQLYRVEIHRAGAQATATFKWSRDNATVATLVSEIHGGNRLVVDSIGRDDVLGFHAGEWIEILDDWHELHGVPGRLHRIRPGDGVDAATRSITLDVALPAGLFPVDAQGRTDTARHTRIRRWDQSGVVRRADGSVYHDLNAAGTSNGIPVPPAGTKLALENGILVDFSTDGSGDFHCSDYWLFAARTADGSFDELAEAPPRGIHHHYARLAVVTLPNPPTDCRTLWPPVAGGESCDCTVCVHAAEHNAGTATIQQAIDTVRARGGGTICLDVGDYVLPAPLNLHNVISLRLRGQGWHTVLRPTEAGGAIDISAAFGAAIENLSIVGAATGEATTAMINVVNSAEVQLDHVTVVAAAMPGATSVAIGLSGLLLDAAIRDCALAAEQGIVSMTTEPNPNYLLTADLRVTDTLLLCTQQGISLTGTSLHYGELRLADNLVVGCTQSGITATGAALLAASIAIGGNVLHVSGAGIVAGSNALRIENNEIVALAGRATLPGIALDSGLDKRPVDRCYIVGNRLSGLHGDGMVIRQRLGRIIVKDNIIENVSGGGFVMGVDAAADYLSMENNQFVNIGTTFNSADLTYFGVLLIAVARADIVGNLFAGVARQATLTTFRAAVGAVATSELRVAANRMFGIGPLTSFNNRAAGIAATAGFSLVVVDDNSVARLASTAEAPSVAGWQAILIAGVAKVAEAAGLANMAMIEIPETMIVPVLAGHIYLTARQVALLAPALGSVQVRANRLHGESSSLPAAEVLGVEGCLFDGNDIGVAGGTGEGQLAGRVTCDHANVANNRFVGSRERATFELHTGETRYAVLGNLKTGPILVNGVADTALPAPWNTLNVTI